MPVTKPRRRSKILLRAGGVLAVLFLLILSFLGYIGLFNGNIRTVIPGKVYRSAQLGPDRLDQLVRDEKLRSVISLRGGEMDDNWFRKENDVCQKNGVALTAIKLTATTYPKPEELRKLLRVFEEAPRPMLLHCRGGADRTGLASTLYLHLYEGMPLKKAREEGLTWRYGHFPFEAIAMDHLMDTLERESTGDVRAWILNRYPVLYKEWRAVKDGKDGTADKAPILPLLGS